MGRCWRLLWGRKIDEGSYDCSSSFAICSKNARDEAEHEHEYEHEYIR